MSRIDVLPLVCFNCRGGTAAIVQSCVQLATIISDQRNIISVLGTVRFWGFDYWYEVLTEDILVLMNHYFVMFHLIRYHNKN